MINDDIKAAINEFGEDAYKLFYVPCGENSFSPKNNVDLLQIAGMR